ncbi:hypothetical protein JOY44_17575 [Phormidium sp. CLA17]|uniref:hypothetical protein n=1 Tax=Leptolyngbya sp. Cla-17 TaxID=2803751 RepID=UPI0018D81C3C|nr:hypothetical protein [Leptolyngbya sp. Cla-17]MBM0743400.1 hypothetical protein [Leptolyngbya sp. Cla-17]
MALSTDNLLQNTQDATSVKIESLAKLYLEGNPVELSDATIAQFCDWLWGEYQSLSLNVEFSWYERYNNVAEMFADIKQSHL